MNRVVPILALALVLAGIMGLAAVSLLTQASENETLSQGFFSPFGGMMGGGVMGRGMMNSGMMQNMLGGANYGYAPYANATPVPADTPIDREIKITARNFQFDPVRIAVRQGETIKFIIANQDVIPHDFVGAFGKIGYIFAPANTTQSVVWVASQKGTYVALCTFHPGMQIQIVVE